MISLQRGPIDPKFQVEGFAPTNRSFSQKTRLNDLSYGIKIWTDFFPFCHNPRVWRTDGHKRDRILIARPRLHSVQRGKNTGSLAVTEQNLFTPSVQLMVCGLCDANEIAEVFISHKLSLFAKIRTTRSSNSYHSFRNTRMVGSSELAWATVLQSNPVGLSAFTTRSRSEQLHKRSTLSCVSSSSLVIVNSVRVCLSIIWSNSTALTQETHFRTSGISPSNTGQVHTWRSLCQVKFKVMGAKRSNIATSAM